MSSTDQRRDSLHGWFTRRVAMPTPTSRRKDKHGLKTQLATAPRRLCRLGVLVSAFRDARSLADLAVAFSYLLAHGRLVRLASGLTRLFFSR